MTIKTFNADTVQEIMRDKISGFTLSADEREAMNPSIPVSESREPRILSAEYGDGYIERAPDGLNADRRNYSLSWQVKSARERVALMTFFEYHKGYIAFNWTPPAETNLATLVSGYTASSIKVICKTWGVEEQDSSVIYNLTAEFMQVFDV